MSIITDNRGNVALYVSFIVALALLSILFIFFSPAMNEMINIYNSLVSEGWVSEQSDQTMDFVRYAWLAVIPLGAVILVAVVIIRAYILHDGGF